MKNSECKCTHLRSEHTKQFKIFPDKCTICKCPQYYRKENTGKLCLIVIGYSFVMMIAMTCLFFNAYNLHDPKDNETIKYLCYMLIAAFFVCVYNAYISWSQYKKIKSRTIGVVS